MGIHNSFLCLCFLLVNRKLSSRINLCLFFLYSAFISKVNVLWNAPFCTIYMVFPCCTKFHFREMMIRWNFYRGKLITILLKIDLIVLIASYTAVSNSPRKKYYIVFLLNSIVLVISVFMNSYCLTWRLKYSPFFGCWSIWSPITIPSQSFAS